jgi:hypothetical protein
MNSLQLTWREANELEAKLYWNKVDALSDLYVHAMTSKDRALINRYYDIKEQTYKLLSDIGYVVSKEGLFMKNEPDIIDQDHDVEFFDACAHDIGRAMHVMKFGPTQ